MDGLGQFLLGVASMITAIGGFMIAYTKINRDMRSMRSWLGAKVRQANGVPIAYIESLPFPGWIKDDEGRYVFINQEFAKRYQCRLADFEGRNDYDLWDAETAAAFQKTDREVMIDRKRIELVESTPNKAGPHASFKYPVRVVKWPIFGDHGKIVAVGGVTIPASDREVAIIERKSEPAIRPATPKSGVRISKRPTTGKIGES